MRCWFLLALAGCGFSPSASTRDASGSDAGGGSDGTPTGSRTLTVALGNGSDELDDFPLLVLLDSTRVDYADVPDPTTGFTFTDASGATLDYDVDHWDPTGQSALWVRVPMIPTTGTTLTMTFGSGQHAAQALATWNGFEQVLHFDTSFVTDSSGGAFAPMPHSVTAQLAPIGNGGGFTGASSSVAFASGSQLYNGWTVFTLEFWVYVDYSSGPAIPVTVMARDPLMDGLYDVTLDLNMGWQLANDPVIILGIPVPLRTWTHVAVTWDGTTMTGWANGTIAQATKASVVVPTTMATDGDASDSFSLGTGFDGALDELELDRDTAHKAQDWIPAEYLSQTDHAITFSP